LSVHGIGAQSEVAVEVSQQVQIALSEAERSLVNQREDLRAIRDRSVSLVTFAALAGTLAGGLGIVTRQGKLDPWSISGTLAFGITALVTAYCQWPRVFTFCNDARIMLDGWQLDQRSPDEVAAYLARYLACHHEQNSKKIRVMHYAFQVGLGAFTLEVISLFVEVRGAAK
jgi:hypothetical protein